jgi:hypothetical protein
MHEIVIDFKQLVYPPFGGSYFFTLLSRLSGSSRLIDIDIGIGFLLSGVLGWPIRRSHLPPE